MKLIPLKSLYEHYNTIGHFIHEESSIVKIKKFAMSLIKINFTDSLFSCATEDIVELKEFV